MKLGPGASETEIANAVDGTERLVHIAGVNRGTDSEVYDGNVSLAQQLARAVSLCERPPRTIVFANSIQAGNGSAYGQSKALAAGLLSHAASTCEVEFLDLRLPNLFGEHGRPFYNAVTATFCHLLASGEEPSVERDKELTLLHAQDAADILIGARPARVLNSLTAFSTVSELLASLTKMAETYRSGDIPDIATSLDRNLFNTYRSHLVESQPIHLANHRDHRGSFVEAVRSRGGGGQSSFSTTEPGVSRGNHYHRRKIERFVVLSGSATISLRKVLTGRRFDFHVSGEEPVAIDMPTMWAHSLTNTGYDTLYTMFWSDDLFDPERPDTITEEV